MDKKTLKFIEVVMNWWENNRRNFPWRTTKNPYKILITEILLRKTTATHANMTYEKFFEKYPTVTKLAKADLNELKEIIEPLGLVNQRSGQILALSKKVVEDHKGKIPRTSEELMELPGVGKYTSAGVMCIAYQKDEPMVDTNFVRVVGRYFNFKSERKQPYADPKLWDLVRDMIPKGKCKEFNLGLIDFSSAICIPKFPRCNKCLLKSSCNYYNVKVLNKIELTTNPDSNFS